MAGVVLICVDKLNSGLVKVNNMRLITLLFLLLSYQANSQILISLLLGDKLNSDKLEFGLDGGVSFSHIRGLSQSKYMADLNLGFYLTSLERTTLVFPHRGNGEIVDGR